MRRFFSMNYFVYGSKTRYVKDKFAHTLFSILSYSSVCFKQNEQVMDFRSSMNGKLMINEINFKLITN